MVSFPYSDTDTNNFPTRELNFVATVKADSCPRIEPQRRNWNKSHFGKVARLLWFGKLGGGGQMAARIAGELEVWPSKEGMANILRAAGLAVVVGRYSIRVEGHSRFNFGQYGGDLGDPVIDANADSVAELLSTASLVSEALGRVGIIHRFELYEDDHEMAGYLHYGWPLPVGE